MIRIEKISIVDLETDAIVNAANTWLQAGGGVCGAIFRAAGYDELQAACDKIGGCDTGDAVITPGFRLKAKYVVHAVGPVWHGGSDGEPELLYGAYKNALLRAKEAGCHSIGFPPHFRGNLRISPGGRLGAGDSRLQGFRQRISWDGDRLRSPER